MWFRVLRDFPFHDQRGAPVDARKGELVDVLNSKESDRLLSLGFIGPQEFGSGPEEILDKPARPFKITKRVGIWLVTSTIYSGGRIHMYQYAWNLAASGAEVWMITNAVPRWQRDYPIQGNLKIAIEGQDPIPPDLDLIVTDSKGAAGDKAYKYKRKHPRVPFVCFNFESPNWVAEYVPAYAKRLQQKKGVFEKADLLLSNSEISREKLRVWLDREVLDAALNPAINNYAISNRKEAAARVPGRPFVLFSARPTDYKGGDLVVDTVKSFPGELDLVIFGRLQRLAREDTKHRLHFFDNETDMLKYACMEKAALVLAPSLFEGYGMVPGEALSVGTRTVAYDLPVLRQAYGDEIIYVPWDDKKAFKRKVHSLLKQGKPEVPKATVERIRQTKGLSNMRTTIERIPYHAVRSRSVSVHLIAYWGFVPESLESVYEYADDIWIAYGPTKLNADVPPDGSLEAIRSFPDPDNKIHLEARDVWEDKLEMREWCARRLRGNRHLLLDGDEVWIGVDKWMEADIHYTCPRWLNFWHDAEHWIYDSAKLAGLRWGRRLKPYGSVCPHYRWSYWRPTYKFRRHPAVVDANTKLLHQPQAITSEMVPEAIIYHLGHCLPVDTMRAKHHFYRKRDGDNPGRRQREAAWHKWDGKLGDIGDGVVAKIDWPLPEIVKRAVARVKAEPVCR